MTWLFSKAMMEAYGSSPCLQERVEAFSAGTSLDGEPFAQLNVMPTPHRFWRNDKTMDASDLSRFGLTLRLLTDTHGEELLMSYLAGFPARTSAALAPAPDWLEQEAAFGPRWHGSFAKWDHASYSWKTAQCSLLGDLESFSETWPRWGLMRAGVSSLRQIPALPTYGSESGSWPTPTANCGTGAGHQGRSGGFNLQTAVRMWPTPVASMCKGSSPASLTRKTGKSRENDRLDHAVMASDGGQLNPTWVEWLMGWPSGWTDLRPLETAKFREWQQQHGGY